MLDFRDHLDKARALAGMLGQLDQTVKLLHRRQCLCLRERLKMTLSLVEERVEPSSGPVPSADVFKELHRLVQKVKVFVDDCCYEDEEDFVLASIRVTAHKERFFQYHVGLDWCSFLVKCVWDANENGKPVYCQTLQKFDWGQKLRNLFFSRDTSGMIAADEEDLKALLKSWIAKDGEHQAICCALLRRLEATTGAASDLNHILRGDSQVSPTTATFTLGKLPIGVGGYGAVYEMKWKEKLFAVKVFEIRDPETINNEVKILESCCHPHIVNLILAYREDRNQFLMMERLSMDLQKYITERKERGAFPIPTLEVLDMILQICEAMLYLNEADKKVSHRDLKPKNILVKQLHPVTDSGIPAVELQVADFGVAKERKNKDVGNTESTSRNTPNQGTTAYRAPEMTGNSGEEIQGSSMKADMYSFAVTCSFILTGTEPYRGYENTAAMIQAIKHGARPVLPASTPPALVNLLKHCWHSHPGARPKSFHNILTELRELKANLLTGAVEAPLISVGGRLNILVLGHSDLVEDVVDHVCDAGRLRTPVEGHKNLTENMNSRPPMCLYGDTKGVINGRDLSYIKAFVKARNERWVGQEAEYSWLDELENCRKRPALDPNSPKLRLHMVWCVCREISDLPDSLKWSEITEKLCGLPVQIVVVAGMQNSESEYKSIIDYGRRHFPKGGENLHELIVKVGLTDGDLKENLWRKCWAAKTRAEIRNAAEIIRSMRERLGSSGMSVKLGVAGAASIRKEVSLSMSADFILHFLCTYWDVPRDKVRDVLERITAFVSASGKALDIKPYEFVKFCLVVAAVVLYSAQDSAGNPRYVCTWDVSFESSPGRVLQTECQECYDRYFPSRIDLRFSDKMSSADIRSFLQSVFERRLWAPLAGGSTGRPDSSFCSKIRELIWCGRNGIVPSNLDRMEGHSDQGPVTDSPR